MNRLGAYTQQGLVDLMPNDWRQHAFVFAILCTVVGDGMATRVFELFGVGVVHDYRSPSTRTILVRVVWQLSPFDLLHVQHEVLALQRAGVIRHPIEIHQQCAKVIVVQVVGVKVNPVFPR